MSIRLAKSAPSRTQLQDVLSAHGLRLRGGWRPVAGDAIAALPGGQSAAVVWMVGAVGSELWPAFSASTFFSDGLAHPLDRWSRAIGQEMAQRWGGVALFPFDGPPYHPFQKWAARAETLHSSPLKLQIHPKYGLWHAYRFALALPSVQADDLASPVSPQVAARVDLCLQCDGQPCLLACPVQAFSVVAYDVLTCRDHLRMPLGANCMQSGCLARRACPQGAGFVYTPEHAAFHMQAFIGAQASKA